MPSWLWWAPLAVLVMAMGIWAFRWGWIAAAITETDVINTYASRYLSEAGASARLTDCAATPGDHVGVWITVNCVDPSGARYDYAVDKFGRLLDVQGSGSQPAAPET
ncbi:MAG: hypothetical protein R8G34_05340 [Paracoccaceae bacterium]|nr:hypothetical protein [Paracoccaceae bacterium]